MGLWLAGRLYKYACINHPSSRKIWLNVGAPVSISYEGLTSLEAPVG